MTFPDGYSDNLLLKKHSDTNDHCHYIGHLENEREACVAVTGCMGKDDLELTVLSKHSGHSPLMRWKLDGSVDVIIPEVQNLSDHLQWCAVQPDSAHVNFTLIFCFNVLLSKEAFEQNIKI